MPKITFTKNQKVIEVPVNGNLMDTLMEAGIPVASSCGGQAVCTKCLVKVIEGSENLSPQTSDEADMRDIHDFAKNERLSCQCKVLGDVKIDTTYW